MKNNKHDGTNFFDYLKKEGIYEEVEELSEKRYGHLKKENKRNILGRIRNFLGSIAGIFAIRF